MKKKIQARKSSILPKNLPTNVPALYANVKDFRNLTVINMYACTVACVSQVVM